MSGNTLALMAEVYLLTRIAFGMVVCICCGQLVALLS
jgi:hypothetical protein